MRKAERNDYPAVETLYRKIIEELDKGVNYPLWQWGVHPDEQMVLDAIDAKELYVELDENGQVVAVGRLALNEAMEPDGIVWKDEGPYAGIHLFGVHPDRKGTGLAGEAFLEMMQAAKKAGCSSIRLDLIAGNLPARRLYEKSGFVSRGLCDLWIEPEGVLHFEMMEYIF